VQLPDGIAGTACDDDRDCAPGRCARELRITSVDAPQEAPGGYCTTGCDHDSQCGGGAACLVPADADAVGACMSQCHTDADCRDGYLCAGAGPAAGAQIAGTCRPVPPTDRVADGIAGSACSADADCAGGRCATTSALGNDFPGNYCTGRCFADEECGAGGACLAFTGSGIPGQCLGTCAADADCTRDGYRCRELRSADHTVHACYPAPDALPDHSAGMACTSAADCGGGECARELPYGSFATYEVVPAPGGYCTQECTLDADCGAGAQCISHGMHGGMCLGACVEGTDCRAGYECIAHLRDGDPEARVCAPLQD
jgi:hypothetical protein